MRMFNIIGGLAVITCTIIVSFAHSIQLAHSGGYTGAMAIIAVLGAEITFIMGALNLLVSRIKGEPMGGSSLFSFFLGVVLILWANINAGIGYGWIGIVWGAFIPLYLISSESVVSEAILQQKPLDPPKSGGVGEIVNQFLKDTGELPSRRKLTKIAGIPEWKARKVLETFKQTKEG